MPFVFSEGAAFDD